MSLFGLQLCVDPALITTWHRLGLPDDTMCVQNTIIISLSTRWPLIIDPHGVAKKWIKGVERSNQLKIITPNQHDFVRALETAVTTGRPLLIENAVIDGKVPRVLDDLLRKVASSSNPPHSVRIANEVNYNKKFKYATLLYYVQFLILTTLGYI